MKQNAESWRDNDADDETEARGPIEMVADRLQESNPELADDLRKAHDGECHDGQPSWLEDTSRAHHVVYAVREAVAENETLDRMEIIEPVREALASHTDERVRTSANQAQEEYFERANADLQRALINGDQALAANALDNMSNVAVETGLADGSAEGFIDRGRAEAAAAETWAQICSQLRTLTAPARGQAPEGQLSFASAERLETEPEGNTTRPSPYRAGTRGLASDVQAFTMTARRAIGEETEGLNAHERRLVADTIAQAMTGPLRAMLDSESGRERAAKSASALRSATWAMDNIETRIARGLCNSRPDEAQQGLAHLAVHEGNVLRATKGGDERFAERIPEEADLWRQLETAANNERPAAPTRTRARGGPETKVDPNLENAMLSAQRYG